MLKVLMVDDEQDFLKIMQARVASWGHKCVCAGSGKEGIAIFTKESPDAIILDYMMPGMDGIAVLKEIRKLDQKVPVVMLTAFPDGRSIKGSSELGIAAFIPKIGMYTDVQFSLEAALNLIEKEKDKDKGKKA